MLKLTLVTPTKRLLTDAEVEEVIIPAFRGQLNILPGHAPLVTVLTAGVMKVRMKGSTEFKSAAISWGYCEVTPSGISVLADTAEWPEEVDKSRAEEALKVAQMRLEQAGLSPAEQEQTLKKVAKERARLDALN